MGIPKSRIDEVGWQAAASRPAHDERAKPIPIDSARSKDALCLTASWKKSMASCVTPGFVSMTLGQFAIGRFLSGAAPADLPIITKHDLTQPPDIRAHGYAELDDRVTISYRDSQSGVQ